MNIVLRRISSFPAIRGETEDEGWNSHMFP